MNLSAPVLAAFYLDKVLCPVDASTVEARRSQVAVSAAGSQGAERGLKSKSDSLAMFAAMRRAAFAGTTKRKPRHNGGFQIGGMIKTLPTEGSSRDQP